MKAFSKLPTSPINLGGPSLSYRTSAHYCFTNLSKASSRQRQVFRGLCMLFNKGWPPSETSFSSPHPYSSWSQFLYVHKVRCLERRAPFCEWLDSADTTRQAGSTLPLLLRLPSYIHPAKLMAKVLTRDPGKSIHFQSCARHKIHQCNVTVIINLLNARQHKNMCALS